VIIGERVDVPLRERQAILGHAHVATTASRSTHVDDEDERDALTGLNTMLGGSAS
jgi:integrase